MKKSIICLFILLSALMIGTTNCGEEEGFHQIAQIEREVYLKINNYRTSNGLSSLVEQFLLFKEARMVSDKIASNAYDLNDPEAKQDLGELADNLGGTSYALLTFSVEVENSDSIMNRMKRTPEYTDILLGEYSQCGVGFSTDSDNNHFVAVMFVEIPD